LVTKGRLTAQERIWGQEVAEGNKLILKGKLKTQEMATKWNVEVHVLNYVFT
jgi:hypothetical protein